MGTLLEEIKARSRNKVVKAGHLLPLTLINIVDSASRYSRDAFCYYFRFQIATNSVFELASKISDVLIQYPLQRLLHQAFQEEETLQESSPGDCIIRLMVICQMQMPPKQTNFIPSRRRKLRLAWTNRPQCQSKRRQTPCKLSLIHI